MVFLKINFIIFNNIMNSCFFNFYNHLFLNVIIKNIKIIYKYNQKGIKY